VNVAANVLTWVQAPVRESTEPAVTAQEDDDAPAPVALEPDVEPEVLPEVPVVAAPRVTTRPSKERAERGRRQLPVGLAVGAAAIAIVGGGAFVVAHRGGGDSAATRSASGADLPQSVPSQGDFSDPRLYGAAMTRLALTSGRTEINGQIACDQNSTWNSWTCQAQGKPSLGAYAGHWLTYRCSPSSTPQPGGRPAAVMINCRPQNPPPLSA
jgi:hypothetical protein